MTRIPRLLAYRQLLSHRAYRLYFASSTLGAFASAVQFLGQGWLVLHVGASGWALVAFLVVRIGIKSLLAIPAGLAADRFCRVSIYAWMRVGSGAASLLAATALVSPHPLMVALLAAAVAAATHALDLPAHRALQGEVQPDEHLERGLSFGTGGFHIASLLAPIAAFPLLAATNPSAPLLLSAIMFLVAAVPAFALPKRPTARRTQRASHDVSTAFRFIIATPLVFALVLATTLPALVDKAVALSLPSQNSGHASMGFVLAAPELGAVAVALMMAGVNWRFAPWIPLVSAGAYAVGVATASFAGFAIGIEMIAVALFLAGCAKTTLITSALAGIQRHVPADMRGRIMTI